MNRKNEDTGIVEETKRALTEDAEVPIEKKVPGSTFSLVALSYLVMLAIGALIVAATLWAYQTWSAPESELPPQSPAAIVRLIW